MMTRILVPLDGSELAEEALPIAATLAREQGAALTLARVPETMVVPVASAGVWITREAEPHEARAEAEAYLARVAARPELAGLAVDVALPHAPVVDGLLAAAEAAGAELLVLTTHGHSGVTRMLLGSVAAKLVHQAPVDVLVVPPGVTADWRPSTVVVPLDGSATAEQALPTAVELSRRAGAGLALVQVPVVPAYLTVVPDTAAMIPSHLQQKALAAEHYLARVAADLAERGVAVRADVEVTLTGGVEQAIVDYATAREAELILMASHGESGLMRMILGSSTDRVLRLAQCPVWVVRAA